MHFSHSWVLTLTRKGHLVRKFIATFNSTHNLDTLTLSVVTMRRTDVRMPLKMFSLGRSKLYICPWKKLPCQYHFWDMLRWMDSRTWCLVKDHFRLMNFTLVPRIVSVWSRELEIEGWRQLVEWRCCDNSFMTLDSQTISFWILSAINTTSRCTKAWSLTVIPLPEQRWYVPLVLTEQ